MPKDSRVVSVTFLVASLLSGDEGCGEEGAIEGDSGNKLASPVGGSGGKTGDGDEPLLPIVSI